MAKIYRSARLLRDEQGICFLELRTIAGGTRDVIGISEHALRNCVQGLLGHWGFYNEAGHKPPAEEAGHSDDQYNPERK